MTIGPDVASIDGNGNPDWIKAQHDGHTQFVGLRASYGTAADSKYAPYAKQLAALKIPCFGYLFLRFGSNVGTPEAQAETAMQVIGSPNRRMFPPVVDLEFGGKRPQGWTADQALEWFLRAWRRMRQIIGAEPGIYTSEVVWVDPDQMDNPSCPEIANAWSWTKYWPYQTRSPAVYDPAIIGSLGKPKIAPPFAGNWQMQQYQGDALDYPGFISTVDLNRINTAKKGDTSGTVAWIQRKLKIMSDGVFGQQTENAVKSFQIASGLSADGVVGLDTYQLLAWA
jgi:GH25 family lysozyme M1 (1,4-beta-N-acetylmuramidase)